MPKTIRLEIRGFDLDAVEAYDDKTGNGDVEDETGQGMHGISLEYVDTTKDVT